MPFTQVEGPEAWFVKDYPGDISQYAYTFTEADLAEITAAVQAIEAKGIDTKNIKACAVLSAVRSKRAEAGL